MGKYLMEIGSMICLKEKENIIAMMALFLVESGKKEFIKVDIFIIFLFSKKYKLMIISFVFKYFVSLYFKVTPFFL
jgi:hypothetical protein